MIFRLLMVTFFATSYCFPPNVLDVSTPEEVNSLERDVPFKRSIDPVNSRNSIEDTVKEVEEIIRSNPALPRLTRGEILDLLENITSLDEQKAKYLGRQGKAVMVVMPYTPTNDKNMEDLFTKAPVTRIIDAEPFKPKDEDNDLAKKPLVPEKKYSASISDKPKYGTRTTIRRKRPEATTQPVPTTYRPSTRRPIRRRTTTATTQHPNHRYEEFLPNEGIRIIQPPKLASKQDILPDLEFQENIRHEVAALPNNVQPTTRPLIEDISFPENLKPVVQDLNLKEAEEMGAKLEEQAKIKEILVSMGVLPESTTKATTTTSTSTMPNAQNVVDVLSPDMKDLLMSFGLLPEPSKKPVVNYEAKFYPEQADITPESYIGFKPLPEAGKSRDDMDALLASFGLGRSARRSKSIKNSDKKDGLNFDMIPSDLKGVITDLGIEQVKEPKAIRTPTVEKTLEKQHVFNPDNMYATDEELEKLEKLINMVKQLEKINGTITEEDLKKIDLESLKELLSSLNNETVPTLEQQNSPDPTNFDLGEAKNEVKRQEIKVEVSTAVAVSAETPSLKDLEESFGGTTEKVTLPPVPETTTRRTGFYYLTDWNTFLDIDDTKGKRVNLRFQPTIGDPKRFLSVSVP